MEEAQANKNRAQGNRSTENNSDSSNEHSDNTVNENTSLNMSENKDLWVAQLIQPFGSASNEVTVQEFFEQVQQAAELGSLSEIDMIRLCRLKITGNAKVFYNSVPRLKASDITFKDFKRRLWNESKHTDQFNFSADTPPEKFLGRLRLLTQKTVLYDEDENVRAVVQQDSEQRVLSAF